MYSHIMDLNNTMYIYIYILFKENRFDIEDIDVNNIRFFIHIIDYFYNYHYISYIIQNVIFISIYIYYFTNLIIINYRIFLYIL